MTKVTGQDIPLSDEELKQKLISDHNDEGSVDTQAVKGNFPTEIIELPSKGLLYPEDSPLSSGEVEMRYMTAADEDILSTPSLIRKGIAVEKVMKALIVNKAIKFDDLLLGDKNAIMIAARVLAYGKEYPLDVTCPNCGEKDNVIIDLTTIEDKVIDEDLIQKGSNLFEFELPASNTKIEFRLLTHRDERRIENELKAYNESKKGKKDIKNIEVTTRLKHSIVSVDGNDSKKRIEQFVDSGELVSIDSLAIRRKISEVNPGVDMSFDFKCGECEYVAEDSPIPITSDFFWPRV